MPLSKSWACCRDRVASYSATTQYDQLMGATYDDSHVFERGGEIEPQAAGQRDAPVLKVSVKDPVKKVPPGTSVHEPRVCRPMQRHTQVLRGFCPRTPSACAYTSVEM